MSFSIFLNFEKLAIKIIEDEIEKMTNDNRRDDGEAEEVDNEKFINNLYHGSIAAAFIVNLYESALNTILGRRLGCAEEEFLKFSLDKKLNLICTKYRVGISKIKSDASYGNMISIKRLRNDIIHYKNNWICDGHYISTESDFAKKFTKEYMEKHYKGVVALIDLICEKCGLVMYKDCLPIDCDGQGPACEFILSRQMYDEQNMD